MKGSEEAVAVDCITWMGTVYSMERENKIGMQNAEKKKYKREVQNNQKIVKMEG